MAHRVVIGLACALLLTMWPPQLDAAKKKPPKAPPGLSVTGKTASSVSLTWNTSELVKLPLKFAVFRDGVQLVILNAAKKSYTDKKVGWGTTYSYFVRVWDMSGNAEDTNLVWVTTDARETRLNVVVILTDDQRWDTLQYMPNVQQLLVASGVTFAEAFASTPTCCPSRAGLLTGLFSHNHGVLSNAIGAKAFVDSSTLAVWLKAAGYRTGLIGKYLNGYSEDVYKPWPYVAPGWDDWHAFRREDYYNYVLVENGSQVAYGSSPAEYSTTVLAAKAVDFIKTTAAGQPFFLIFSPRAPHSPATQAKEDTGAFAGLPLWRPPSFNEADVSDKPAWVRELPLLTEPQITQIDALRRSQLRSLLAVDRAVKALVDAVTAAGRLHDTVFIFTSDNGQTWGEHRWDAKIAPYDESARVPLVIRVSGAAPRVDRHLVSLIDLVPSIASWAGILHPKVDGLSLARLTVDAGISWRDAILIEMLHGEAAQQPMLYSAVRTSAYLYAEYLNGDRELYDMPHDPYQLMNVVANPAYASIIAVLRTRLDTLKKQ